MITLITGAPGSGKTLYCVDKIIHPLIGTTVKGEDESGNPVEIEREIYTNINGLVLPHHLIDAEWLKNLPENKKTGAVVVFDEVQRVWPNRPTGSKKPLAVEYLETHRHDGIDVVLLTQNPQLLDPAVRALVGRHLHMRRLGGVGAAVVYEWDACANSLNFKSAFAKRGYRYSKRVFKLYQSAKLHTKQQRSMPAAVWGILIGLGAFSYFGPKFADSLASRASQPVVSSSAKSGQSMQTGNAAAGFKPGRTALDVDGKGPAFQQMTPEEYRASYIPRLASLPHTAPRYEQITAPSRAPVPAACIQSKSKGCQCWTQDATRLFIPHDQCAAIVQNGYFLDFVQPGASSGAVVSPDAVHWNTNGDGLAVKPADVRGTDHDAITPAQIAKLSRATTGANPWARDAVAVVPQAAASKPKI